MRVVFFRRGQDADDKRSLVADAIIVAIDIEAFERNHNKITEIGVTSFDLRTLGAIPEGGHVPTWLQNSQSRHFRIKEHNDLVNKRYVQDCAHRFDFGRSEMINVRQIKDALTKLLKVQDGYTLFNQPKYRSVILVGHAFNNETMYMRNSLDFDADALGTIIGTIDTQVVAPRYKNQLIGLERLLNREELKLEPVNLHNAGNDAAYTFAILLLLAVRDTNGSPMLPPATTPKMAVQAMKDAARARLNAVEASHNQSTAVSTKVVVAKPEDLVATGKTSYYTKPRKLCTNCYMEGHEARSCWQKRVCSHCGKKGHIKRFCKQLRQ